VRGLWGSRGVWGGDGGRRRAAREIRLKGWWQNMGGGGVPCWPGAGAVGQFT
jgi:hypothetical protein